MKPTCIPDKLYESQKDVFDAVIAEVIEACAKVCDDRADMFGRLTDPAAPAYIVEADWCAAAIRVRGMK